MTATVSVQCGKSMVKDNKDLKERIKERKDGKEIVKERKDLKDRIKDTKEFSKERKDLKDRVEFKRPKELFERPGGGFLGGFGSGAAAPDLSQTVAELDARVAAIEAAMGAGGETEPFIGSELRPDLEGGPDYSAEGNLQDRMAAGDRDAKVTFDTLPPRT